MQFSIVFLRMNHFFSSRSIFFFNRFNLRIRVSSISYNQNAFQRDPLCVFLLLVVRWWLLRIFRAIKALFVNPFFFFFCAFIPWNVYPRKKTLYFFFIANVCRVISVFRIRHQSTGCNTELSLRASIVLRGCILQRHSRDHTEGLWSRTGWVIENYFFTIFKQI